MNRSEKGPSIEDVGIFFNIFDLYPHQSAIFFTTIRRQIWQILDTSTLKNADVLTLSGTGLLS